MMPLRNAFLLLSLLWALRTRYTWMDENEETFKQYGMQPAGHVCVTAIKGVRGRLEERYRDSRTKAHILLEQLA
ncbi:hypothetical protein SERLA73DRAFT_187335 [Serpula lacrymans var. lacrymans S7.3]|uniref:Uncharacterized protein n=2 Tax=Serpula lacrymans var. lacrymans TaxID=341189 RepID=F8Q8Z4_SERL3|nr:uncharacterized protein SERLADRAFT_476815 [Serpula lacrymans var. lacrymans S7.9]EGN95049.1 hypothetical protein SERLA73DRAFT_187335 [Serpula lacrymans var. lacrymans S7.3]EGO20537.1 hypothetical protein SERLADRAFT_476815 [Serpula lacrymans var. lacrymans S7.9]